MIGLYLITTHENAYHLAKGREADFSGGPGRSGREFVLPNSMTEPRLYHVTVVREAQFTMTIPANSRADIIQMVTAKALEYDSLDNKSTKIVSIHETQTDPLCDIPT